MPRASFQERWELRFRLVKRHLWRSSVISRLEMPIEYEIPAFERNDLHQYQRLNSIALEKNVIYLNQTPVL